MKTFKVYYNKNTQDYIEIERGSIADIMAEMNNNGYVSVDKPANIFYVMKDTIFAISEEK